MGTRTRQSECAQAARERAPLTSTQVDIARRLAEGHLYPQIAADLQVSVEYVRIVVSAACGRLGLVGDRMLLALWYRDHAPVGDRAGTADNEQPLARVERQ